MSVFKSSVDQEDLNFISDSKTAILANTPPLGNFMLYFLALVIFTGLMWAKFAIIDEVTVGEGKVIPSSSVQIIQNLEGGIVSELNVREGQIVEKGQVLLRLSPIRFKSSFDESKVNVKALQARVTRLQALANDRDVVVFSKALHKNYPEIARHETNIFTSMRQGLIDELSVLENSLNLAREELAITEPLVAQGVMSRIELLRLRREVNDLQRQFQEKKDTAKQKILNQLSEQKSQHDAMVQSMRGLEDRMLRTTIRSPVKGTVNNIHISNVGGVVSPGVDIMEIVPLEDQLTVEAKINPSDIAFIKSGDGATVKVSAYDFAIYGGLTAVLEQISPDTIVDEEGNSYYEVKLKTDKNYLGSLKNPYPIIPGMTVTAHILTGHKSVLDYILHPILRAKEQAFRER